MSAGVPECRTVTVHAFRGSRGSLGRSVWKALDEARHGHGGGPTRVQCLLYAGHAGVSTDQDTRIFGFHPDFGNLPIWQEMQRLKNGEAFSGVVVDDSQVFAQAAKHRLKVGTFDVILPDPAFQPFAQRLATERQKSQYTYGFPNGDGDCNCITWLERLALPLLTGSMDEFTTLPGFIRYPRRRFGKCQ